LINWFNLFGSIGLREGALMCLVKNRGNEYKILFVELRMDELGFGYWKGGGRIGSD
jgi:hypothetical protein